jgi:hypothetical protein
VEPRAQRQALRQYLNSAREALEQGDRAAAVAAVDAALALDPHYLAAQALKEQIDRWPAAARVSRLHERLSHDAFARHDRDRAPAGSARARVPHKTDSPPAVSAEGWLRFEQRARTRRLEHRIEAARVAIARRRFGEARAIIDEIRELDDGHPDLISLWIELDAGEHMALRSTPRWRRALVAAVVIGGVWLGARYADRVVTRTHEAVASNPLRNTPAAPPVTDEPPAAEQAAQAPAPTPIAVPETPIESAPSALTPPADTKVPDEIPDRLPEASAPAPVASPALSAPIARAAREVSVPPVSREPAPFSGVSRGTTGVAPEIAPPPQPPPLSQPPALVPAVSAVALPATPAIERPAVQPPDTVPARLSASVEPAAARAMISAGVVTPPADEERVRTTLQAYRAAYEKLDARSAQAIWPGVDEAALTRAFSGLQSQRLMFDDCEVQVQGARSHATCRGTAVYVPRVGSRDPRREPRVWTFDLRKVGEDWQIDTARAER